MNQQHENKQFQNVQYYLPTSKSYYVMHNAWVLYFFQICMSLCNRPLYDMQSSLNRCNKNHAQHCQLKRASNLQVFQGTRVVCWVKVTVHMLLQFQYKSVMDKTDKMWRSDPYDITPDCLCRWHKKTPCHGKKLFFTLNIIIRKSQKRERKTKYLEIWL